MTDTHAQETSIAEQQDQIKALQAKIRQLTATVAYLQSFNASLAAAANAIQEHHAQAAAQAAAGGDAA